MAHPHCPVSGGHATRVFGDEILAREVVEGVCVRKNNSFMKLYLFYFRVICFIAWETYLRVPKRSGTLVIDLDKLTYRIEP